MTASVSPLDATGVKFWDASTGTWISAARGAVGPVGPVGPVGVAASERAVSLAHRNLGGGQSMNQGWNYLTFGSAAASAAEVNPPIAAQDAGSHRWRFLKTGAYLVTATMWLTGGAPAVPNMCLIGLFRQPMVGSEIEWARNQFGPGGGAQSLTALVLARADDMWHMGFYRTTSGSQAHGPTSIYVSPVGPCRVGGDYDYAVLSSHADYNSGATTVSSYTIVPPAASNVIVPGDWMYLVHLHPYTATNPTVTPPQGWEVVVPCQPRNTAPDGISWGIWRKKYAAGDECQVNLSAATQVRATLLIVRQQTDAKPTVGNLVAPRGAVNPAKVTVPGAAASGIAVYIAMLKVPNATAANPVLSAPATAIWFTAGAPATENLWLSVGWQNPPTTTGPVDFTWSGIATDTGQAAGVSLTWPRVAFP